eukprot:TRINITY_DN4302_c0_g1_i2.p2 TRINITY_DN4302_c0_g1~~TRINITY_DN4302_c0_g1_i2.p2  ORF type:complete len:207 (-),score=69.78 TRINITY_DN4302_c0_g1_i2:16-636(-)
MLTKKDEEIAKLKESLASLKSPLKLKKHSRMSDSSIPFMSSTLVDRYGSFSSAASLDANEKYVIAQLRQQVKNLNEVIAMQSQTEQGLSKRVQYLENSRSKEEINYEYIKNVFLKYLIFRDSNEEEAKRLRDILLDLLKASKQEKEILEKARSSKSFWKLFTSNRSKDEMLLNLSSSYFAKPKSVFATMGSRWNSKIEEEVEECYN